jgi:hypothetical protein
MSLPNNSEITIHVARIYRGKLVQATIPCIVSILAPINNNYRVLYPQVDVPKPFARFLRAYYAPKQYFWLGFGFDTPEQAIKAIYKDDYAKFTKAYHKYDIAKKVISQTHPHLFH